MSTYPDPRTQPYAYAQQPPQYQQPPPQQQPPQQPYYGYPGQPQPYAQPAGYGYPGPYGPPPGYYVPAYYAPIYAPQPDYSKSTVAGVMWVLCLVRDLLFLIYLVTIGSFLGGMGMGFWGLTGGIMAILIVFPILGIIGCAIAMMADFQRKNYSMGTAGAVLGLVGSSFPGIILVGPVGLVLAIIGLVLHMSARTDFTSG
ncbi:MAG TPA: hypothetical protein VJ547_13195 [Candidatus Thermoplasmatota archaeon]|nr:hypothetical protein [Candidatus Thermoplasmatota archaeon]